MASLKKNFFYSTLYQLLAIVLPLITAPYVSRVLGPENVGIYSYTYSIANYFVLIAMLGFKNYGLRCIAKVRDDKELLSRTFWSAWGLQVITSSIMFIAYLVYLFAFQPDYWNIVALQTLYVVSSVTDISWFFFGLEKFKVTTIRNMVIRIIGVFLIFIFVKDKSDLEIYVAILSINILVSQLSLWPFMRKLVYFRRPTIKDIMAHLKPCAILFLPVIAVSLYNIMDKVMLGSMSTMVQSGFYENTEKIINIPYGIIIAMGNVMLPRMTNIVAQNKTAENKKYIEFSMDFVMFLGSAMAFGIAGIGPVFAPVFFGEEFSECGSLIQVISIIIIFKAWANVIRTQYLIPNEKDKDYIMSLFAGAIANLIFNSLLIRSLGAMGAVIGTVIAEGIVSVFQTVTVRKALNCKKFFRDTVFYLFAGFIMFFVVIYLGNLMEASILTIIVQILIGGSIYIILCTVYLLIDKKNGANQYLKAYIKSLKGKKKL